MLNGEFSAICVSVICLFLSHQSTCVDVSEGQQPDELYRDSSTVIRRVNDCAVPSLGTESKYDGLEVQRVAEKLAESFSSQMWLRLNLRLSQYGLRLDRLHHLSAIQLLSSRISSSPVQLNKV